MASLKIRKGTPTDIPELLNLIKELAAYENEPDAVTVTEEILLNDGFGEKPAFEFLVAEKDGTVVGIALYYYQYSTWKGRSLYLEDVIVKESERMQGIGGMLMNELISISKKEKMKRLDWQVLDWNQPAISFYKKYNTQFDNEWINCRLTFD